MTMENNYAYDPNWKIYFNDEKIDYSYENILELLKKNHLEINEFKILYSNTDSGKNAFEVAKQIIWYPITEDKDDDYYLEKEWNRWKNK
jgi:hypothetical protein